MHRSSSIARTHPWRFVGGAIVVVAGVAVAALSLRDGTTTAAAPPEAAPAGAAVVGRITVPEGFTPERSIVMATLRERIELPPPQFPPGWGQMSVEERQAWYKQRRTTDRPRIDLEALKRYSVSVDADGSFRVEGVEPGRYTLRIELIDRVRASRPEPGNLTWTVHAPVEVSPSAEGALDVGLITSRLRNHMLQPGDLAPPWDLQTIDGERVRLSDFSGRYVLLDLWAFSCPPCIQQIPRKRALREAVPEERLVMIGVCYEYEPERLHAYLAADPLPWPQVIEGGDGRLNADYGPGGLPTYVLIGPNARLVVKTNNFSEVEARLLTPVQEPMAER